MQCTISAKYHFEAAHFLPLVPAEHKCKRMHGHNYEVEVGVTDEVSPKDGMVMDYALLDKLVKDIIGEWDHQVLNDYMYNPTAENIAAEILTRLKDVLNVKFITVTVWETKDYTAKVWG